VTIVVETVVVVMGIAACGVNSHLSSICQHKHGSTFFGLNQGDQIWRILPIACFLRVVFFNYRRGLKFWATFFHSKDFF
jgi:fucose permease